MTDADEDRDDLFERWCRAIGMPDGFPRLGSLRDSTRLFLHGALAEDYERAYRSLGGSRVITTAAGHGATTLARWLRDRLHADSITRRKIPVLVSIEDLLTQDYDALVDGESRFLAQAHPGLGRREFLDLHDEDVVEAFMDAADGSAKGVFGHITAQRCREAIESRVRFEVVRSIATQPWEHVIARSAHRDLLGLQSATPAAFSRSREQLSTLYSGTPLGCMPNAEDAVSFWVALERAAPRLVEAHYTQLVRELAAQADVRVSLISDLSATPMGRQYLGDPVGAGGGEYLTSPYADVLGRFAAAMKNLEQDWALGARPNMLSFLEKTYVIAEGAWSLFNRDFKTPGYERIAISPMRSLDLFAVLAYRYPHSQTERPRIETMAAVLDSEYINLTAGTAISTEMVLLKEAIRAALSKRKSIPYQQRRDQQALRTGPRRVFLCYSRVDKQRVRRLYDALVDDGFAPWLDDEDLLPGEHWEPVIRTTLRAADFVVVCLSEASRKTAGYVHNEIKEALAVADAQPEGAIFLIPLRLEECEVPASLMHLTWVDLFTETGYARLRRSLVRP